MEVKKLQAERLEQLKVFIECDVGREPGISFLEICTRSRLVWQQIVDELPAISQIIDEMIKEKRLISIEWELSYDKASPNPPLLFPANTSVEIFGKKK